MSTAFLWLALAGIGLLLLAALVLVWINWSQQVYMQLLSASLVGTITFLLTFVSSLKATTEQTMFATSVVEDTGSHLPVFATPGGPPSAAMFRATELSSIARGLLAANAGATPTASAPSIAEGDVTRFNLELLQYLVVRELRDRQRVSWSVTQLSTASGGVSQPKVNRAPELSDPLQVKGEAALRLLASNRFATSPFERFGWEHVALTLPKGAGLVLTHDAGGEGKGPESVSVIIERRDYFSLGVTITPIGAATPGFLPEGFEVAPADRPYWRTHHYVISAKARFHRLTAGNWRTDENKAWVQWAFKELESRLKD